MRVAGQHTPQKLSSLAIVRQSSQRFPFLLGAVVAGFALC
jgi:hypothetical protein